MKIKNVKISGLKIIKTKCFSIISLGEMAEWFKAHAWKVCVSSQVPWVRIPLSPPLISTYNLDDFLH